MMLRRSLARIFVRQVVRGCSTTAYGGINVVAHRPRNIVDILQTDHFEITVQAAARTIDVRQLSK